MYPSIAISLSVQQKYTFLCYRMSIQITIIKWNFLMFKWLPKMSIFFVTNYLLFQKKLCVFVSYSIDIRLVCNIACACLDIIVFNFPCQHINIIIPILTNKYPLWTVASSSFLTKQANRTLNHISHQFRGIACQWTQNRCASTGLSLPQL